MFPDIQCVMKVDFARSILIYPEQIMGRERNTWFNQSENFVVFECVNRLLEKGYRPEHIELEKVWQLGHEQKGGRADICVYDENGDMLFIIECKTYGKEFDKYYKRTIADGGQLFSYWQQERATKWLILYASDFDGKDIIYKAPTINCTDYKSVLESAKKDATVLSYQNAQTNKQLFEAWKETYACKFYYDLIFSSESRAYQIGIKPLLKRDLRDFTPDDRIVNKFEEILRHNNVSDKENAFNRLVALFICKLVDEITKGENEEVAFQYKQGTDTYETLQDRLQWLYTVGMEKFMNEKIFYVSDDYPEWLFATYTGHQRQRAIEDLKAKIRILKFYSNNDFSFKDVHNKELFYQNGKILVEVVQLFEQYRIVYPSKHQFLGDLFELLLNKGFKQNEGQFFTPMPITRFIWDCLPLERILHSGKGVSYPKVIDYACGAGHFLTEAVEAINAFADNGGDTSWVHDYIFGIEKDYRLARVSKISLFMNGAGGGNIIFGDGLENLPDRGIENNSFDLLVANPPYSVTAFKQHLQLKNNTYELLDSIKDNGGEIEVLFIERIAQLLKPKGIAAVILPATILSNDTPGSYIGAREQILKNFFIRAIVQLGNKTFSETGTNTIVLFLEKFDEPPKKIDLIVDSVDAILNGTNITEWKDQDIFESYLAQIEVSEDDYTRFIDEALSLEEIQEINYFKMYLDSLLESSEVKNLRKKKGFQKKSNEEQNEEIAKRFYRFAKSIEKDKIFYFALVYEQQTVIITAPKSNKEQEIFLGYNWSKRKGNEGIKIIVPGGKMYDAFNRKALGTLACAVRQSYEGIIPQFSDEQAIFGSIIPTKNAIDFSRIVFNKAINPSGIKAFKVESKFTTRPLVDFTSSIEKGTAITQTDAVPGQFKVVAGGKKHAYFHHQFNREPNVITVSGSGANAGFVNYWEERIWASDCTTIFGKDLLTTKWLYYYLCFLQDQIYSVLQRGASQPHVYKDDIKQIPVPDIDSVIIDGISLKSIIVNECDAIEKEIIRINGEISVIQDKIRSIFDDVDNATIIHDFRLNNKRLFDISIGKRVLSSALIPNGTVPVFSANVFEPFGYINDLLLKDFSLDSVLWGIDGDWMVNFYAKGKRFYPTDHCGVLRLHTDQIHPRYMAHILEQKGLEMNFSRSNRAAMERIEAISFSVPSIEIQNEAMTIVLALEHKISEFEKQVVEFTNQIIEIIKKYL